LRDVAYNIEYGVETDKPSCLAFLLFAKASRQSKLRLFGNFSDERHHIVGGSEHVPRELAARLGGQNTLGRRLVAAPKRSDGRVELTFKVGSRTVTATHDAVVLALPFHLLRNVQLDASLGLPNWKRYALDPAVPRPKARARRDASGPVVCHLEHWPSNPLVGGGYTANQPGYFTTIADNEGKQVGSLYFAGETTDSFCSWQAFMEGGALSAAGVVGEIIKDFR
jgi:monoamine oxidase